MRQSPIFRNISAGRAAVIASDETNLNATQRYTIMLLVTSAAILGVMLILIFRRTRHNRRAFESLAANHELLQTATDRLTTSLSLLQDSSDAQEQLCNSLSSDIIRNNSREVNQRVCRLMYLTENLLAWSLSNDHLAYAKPAEVNVCGVCERVLASLRIEAEARGIVISTVINGDPAVWCDPFHFEVVMRNVLDNAVKYSESDGLLRMAAESDGLQTVIRVSNSGTAMPEMESRNTSRNRCQSPMAGPDGTTGLGIGLAICRRMLAANNGTLTIGRRQQHAGRNQAARHARRQRAQNDNRIKKTRPFFQMSKKNNRDELTYTKTVDELKALLEKLQDPELPLEKLLPITKEMSAKLDFCRNYLSRTEDELSDVLGTAIDDEEGDDE